MSFKKFFHRFTALILAASLSGAVFGSAESAGPNNFIYASASGGGDGKSAESPMSFDDALNAVKDDGTVYIIGTVGSAETGHYPLGRTDKAINFVGVGSDAAITSKNTYNLAGKISFSNLRFTPANRYDPFGFKSERKVGVDVTFGENITTPTVDAFNRNVAFLTANTENKMTVNSGNFGIVAAGGWGASLAGVSTDITVNGGSVDTLAVAYGYRKNTDSALIWKGNYSFTVNGGTVNNITMGHTFQLANTTHGVVKAVINGGTVGTLCMTADRQDTGSSGLRIAEINGGSVNTVKVASQTPIYKNYKTIAIFNNSTADSAGSISGIDTVIRAGEGGKVSAVTEKNAVIGYKIESNNIPVIDGEIASPDEKTGLYSISGGEHTVEFAPMVLYASSSGGGSGYSVNKPTTMDDALNKICDGGTIRVIGNIGTLSSCYSLGSQTKTVHISGMNSASSLSAGKYFSLAGSLEFSNITFKVSTPAENGFIFERSDNNEVIFGEYVSFPSGWKENLGRIFPAVENSSNKITVKSGSLSVINAAQYNGGAENVNTEITIDGGSVGSLAVAHGFSPGGWNNEIKWSGRFDFTVNGGNVGEIVLGHTQGGLRSTNGAVTATVNGGTVGTIVLNAVNKDLTSAGLRLLQINGGSIDTVKSGAEPVHKNFKTVVILNNGMSENIENLSLSSADTVIKAFGQGTVSACLEGNSLRGYKIETEKIVSIDGEIAFPNPQTGLYSISGGVHNVAFLDDTYKDFARRNTWVQRAEDLLNRSDIEFVSGLESFRSALAVLKTANAQANDSALIGDLKIAWNNLKYTVSGSTASHFLYDYGDANGDGVVDILDLVRSKKHIAVKAYVEEYTLDLNDDNLINAEDLALLREKILLRAAGKTEIKKPEREIIPEPDEAYKLNRMTGGADAAASELRDKILNSADNLKVTGTKYYISPNGNDSNSGLSPETPLKTLGNRINSRLKPGDAVLLERGGVFRLGSSYACVNGVSYGAYGEGNKPAVYGSVTDFADPGYWELTEIPNVWKIKYRFSSDVGIMVFNHGERAGRRMNNIRSLSENGDFVTDLTGSCLYLYYDAGSPGSENYSIEIGTRTILFNLPSYNADNITIDNICFKYSGNFAIRASINSKNITVTNCEIGWIGGALQPDGKNVYGNGIELIGGTQNAIIRNCWIYQIFDSAVTFQGYHNYSQYEMCYKNISIENNLMEYCGMSAFEWWARTGDPDGTADDTVIDNISVSGNIMRFTGYGWVKGAVRGARTVQGPWGSYIYSNMSDFVIADNIFDISLGGMYSFPFYSEPAGHIMKNNTYYQISNLQNPYQPNVASRYGKYMYATNQSEFELAIASMEKSPRLVKWLG